MDPTPLGTAEWSEISSMITTLWVVLLFVVLFAANMLIGHNCLPTLVASQHVPRSFQKTRPVFYLLALACMGVALFFFAEVVDYAGVLRRFWADYWI